MVVIDFLARVAVGLAAVLGLIVMIGLGMPQRRGRAVSPRLREPGRR